MARTEFVQRVLAYQADPELAGDLAFQLAGEMTDELPLR